MKILSNKQRTCTQNLEQEEIKNPSITSSVEPQNRILFKPFKDSRKIRIFFAQFRLLRGQERERESRDFQFLEKRNMASFRGLVNFISDIRKCQSKEDERVRVYKEMANIRQKFTQGTSGKKLSSYDNKKYVFF